MLAEVVYPFAKNGVFSVPRHFALSVLAVGLPSTVFVYVRDPSSSSYQLFHCFWLVATGTYCPGCGLTRAAHDLMHGRVIEALDHNALGLVMLAIVAVFSARPLLVALAFNRWEPPAWPRGAAYGLLGCSILWWLLRNLPWAPFTVLAP